MAGNTTPPQLSEDRLDRLLKRTRHIPKGSQTIAANPMCELTTQQNVTSPPKQTYIKGTNVLQQHKRLPLDGSQW